MTCRGPMRIWRHQERKQQKIVCGSCRKAHSSYINCSNQRMDLARNIHHLRLLETYSTLEDEGCLRLHVTHSVEFVYTADSGEIHPDNLRCLARQQISVHTQNIERKRLSLKYSIAIFGQRKKYFERYLAEYIFKTNILEIKLICEFFGVASLLYFLYRPTE